MQFHLADRLSENRSLRLVAVLALGIGVALGLAALLAYTSPLVAVALVGALIVGAVVVSSIELAFYALIAVAVLLPFAALPLNVGFVPTLLDLALVAVLTLWVLRALMREEEGMPFTLTPLGAPVLGFMGLAIFSFVLGMAHAGLTVYVVRHFAEVLIAILFFFTTANLIQTRERLERLVTVILVIGFVSAALGILFYFLPRPLTVQILSLLRVFKYPSGTAVLRFIDDDPQGTLRAVSTTVDPNVLGGLMVLVGGLMAPQLFAERPLLRRPVLAGMLAAVLLCLILTFSRAALLGLVAALVLIAATRYRRLLVILALGAVIFYFAPVTQSYVGRFQDALLGADRATQMRLGEYKDALILISRNPFFGVGFLGTPDIDTYLGVSSVYFLMAEEMGLVGLGMFLLTMAAYYIRTARLWLAGLAADRGLAPIVLGASAALLGSMTAGLFDHYFFNLDFPHSVTLFWIFAGLSMAAQRIYSHAAESAS